MTLYNMTLPNMTLPVYHGLKRPAQALRGQIVERSGAVRGIGEGSEHKLEHRALHSLSSPSGHWSHWSLYCRWNLE
jgi:hypothetical protein